MVDTASPFLVLYVVWHPDYSAGKDIAAALFSHFRRDTYEDVTGGTGISVIYRFAPADGKAAPRPINLDEGQTSAVVALIDDNFVSDPIWVSFLRGIASDTAAKGLSSRLFPVVVDDGLLARLNIEEQALRWFSWKGDSDVKVQKLVRDLTYQFCRMLRHYLAHLTNPNENKHGLLEFLQNVEIFLSHSKHDKDNVGERIATALRKKLSEGGLDSFFDVLDIPPGVKFNEALFAKIPVSAVVAIHTDSFSSREWCRREIIEAKRHNRPLVIANCMSDRDERGFPYLGNVPIIRFDPGNKKRLDVVVSVLLDEVFRDFLWKCRVELMRPLASADVTFLPRPPELISLAALSPSIDDDARIIVYPNPPVGAEEERLFFDIAPKIQLRSANEFQAGAIR